ncbi:hypothetical protein RDI58_015628 [Solanum bulbocastanum]|uniref:Uncharacterized protein n=1 Tax=Solanum bulbocastanum TaxID=147425 RepID=A0AAN8TLX2_SOLBU
MSLSCLTCKITRTDSTNEFNEKKFNNNVDKNNKEKHKFSRRSVERSWSGNLESTSNEKKMSHSLSIIPENKVKKGSHRTFNSGPIEFPTETPKLVRSPGISRDWSFEDLQR